MQAILELRRKRATVVEEARAIVDKAAEEERPLTAEEETRFESLMVEAEGCQKAEEREIRLQGLSAGDLENLTAIKPDPGEEAGENRANPWKSFGEQLRAVMEASRPGGTMDPRLLETRATGLSEGIPSEGGFLVHPDYAAAILKRAYATGILASKCTKLPLSPTANGIKINAIDETSRATGSRWGGVRAYWLAEAEEKTKSKPKFRQMELSLNKLIGLCYATDELIADATALEAIIVQAFAEEFGFLLDDGIFNGTGAGQPIGILTSGSLISQAKETNQAAATIVFENISKMWARMWAKSRANAVWFINQEIEPELDNMYLPVGTGGSAVYLPAGGLNDSPYARLKGRPVMPIEQCAALGTVGDIVLADLSQYVLVDKGGVQSAQSIHVKFEYDETVFRFVYRVDGQPIWNSALTPYKGSNTLSPFVALATRS